jgi:dihydrofolate synthase / folylpolyglutamate synthase
MSRLAAYLQDLQRFGIQPGLERIKALLQCAGNPHLTYPHLLVGGTNGKGSTCEFTARLLAQGGRRIGLFTSPHLYEWNERVRVLPGEGLFEGSISQADLDQLFNDALTHIEAVTQTLGQPTEFEVVTFLGLWHFARQKVDAAVLEVGLGGKWDATNVTDPLVSCVTHVALDHQDRLGNTLEAIAADKVCIARAGRPFLTAETRPNVLDVFREHCNQIGAPLRQIAVSSSADFQTANRDLAHAVAHAFADAVGWTLPEESDIALSVPGRHETISESPRIVIDGANNPEGAELFARYLKAQPWFAPEKTILVLAILADKDWRAMTHALAPLAKTILCTQSNSPRALSVFELGIEVTAHYGTIADLEIEEHASVAQAVARARELVETGGTILVTGSFTTIAEVPR